MPLTYQLTIGLDIGGTKVMAGVVDPLGNVIERTRRETPTQDPTRTEDVIAIPEVDVADAEAAQGELEQACAA